MFLLSKIVDQILLPPGLFISISVFCLVLLFLGKNRLSRIVLLVDVALFYLLAIEPVKDLLLLPLENRYPPLGVGNHERLSAIVVLGGGIVCKSPEEHGRTSLAPDSLKRIVYGKLLNDTYGLPVIVSAGYVTRVAGCEPEAWAAKRVLLSLGVNADRIFIEDASRNTWENARYIEEKYKPERVLLVTSAYHMKRSVYCFEKNNIQCLPAPTDYKANRAGYSYRSFFPSMVSFGGSYNALKEYVGWVYYKLRYK